MVDYTTTSPRNRSSGWKRAHTQQSKRTKTKAVKYRTSRKREVDVRTVLGVGLDWAARLVLAGVLVYAVLHGYRFFTTAPQFNISRVTFHGNKVVDTESLHALAAPVFGENILQVDLEAVLKPIRHNTWVRDVSVIRKLPQSLHVHIQERTPYARIQLDTVYLMDHYGVLIAPDSGGYDDLPLIRAPAGQTERVNLGEPVEIGWIIPGLQAMHSLNQLEAFRKNPFQTFRYAAPRHLIFTSRHDAVTVRMAVDRLREGFDNFKIVLEAMQSDVATVRFIDLSFADRVVVRDQYQEGTGSPIKQS